MTNLTSKPRPCGHKFHNYCRGFLAQHNHVQLLKGFFLKTAPIFTVFIQNLCPPRGGGHGFHNFCSPPPINATHQIWSR